MLIHNSHSRASIEKSFAMYLPLLPTTPNRLAPEAAVGSVRASLHSTALPHGRLQTLPVMGIPTKTAVTQSNGEKGWMPVAYKDILVYIRRSIVS
jgi:hypothetical protein